MLVTPRVLCILASITLFNPPCLQYCTQLSAQRFDTPPDSPVVIIAPHNAVAETLLCAALQSEYLPPETVRLGRACAITQVLGTDMKKHFDILSRFQVSCMCAFCLSCYSQSLVGAVLSDMYARLAHTSQGCNRILHRT